MCTRFSARSGPLGNVTAHLLIQKSWEKLGNNDIHDCVTRLLAMSDDA